MNELALSLAFSAFVWAAAWWDLNRRRVVVVNERIDDVATVAETALSASNGTSVELARRFDRLAERVDGLARKASEASNRSIQTQRSVQPLTGARRRG